MDAKSQKYQYFLIAILFSLLSFAISSPELNAKFEATEHVHLDTPLTQLIPELLNVTIEGIKKCFESINDSQSSSSALFLEDSTLRHVLLEYYGYFSQHPVTKEQIDNLIGNLMHIVKHVFQCSFPENRHRREAYDTQTYKLGLTSMSDKNPMAYVSGHPIHRSSKLKTNPSIPKFGGRWGKCDGADLRKLKLPKSYDFREKHPEMLNVSMQGACQACWAFTVAGIVQGAYLNKGHKMGALSPQYLIDFSKKNAGCDGGYGVHALRFVQRHGIVYEDEYPYRGKRTYQYPPKPSITIANYCYMNGHVKEKERMQQLYKYGPLWIPIEAGDPHFVNYKSGIYKDTGKCRNHDDPMWHAMTLVGYTENAWIVRNSWSDKWGEKGFVYIQRGNNTCSIDSDSGYAIV